MSYVAELKIISDKKTNDTTEEVSTKYVISTDSKEDLLKLLKGLVVNQVAEDIE